jgi:RimJ/RimL family protein N-acetyltransferase
LIGRIDFDDINPIDRTAELSIVLGEQQSRGHGYGRDAMRVLIEHLFNDRQIEKIWLSVIVFNTPAIRLYESLGFSREGSLRKTIWLDGQWHDLLLMGLFRTDYRLAG